MLWKATVLTQSTMLYKAVTQQSKLLPYHGMWSCSVQARHLSAIDRKNHGPIHFAMVRTWWGIQEAASGIAKELGATHCVNGSKEDVVARCTEICGHDNLGLVIECSGTNIALKQYSEILRPNGEVVRVGMGFKPLEFSINTITEWNKSIIGHMAYDSESWRNSIRLLASGAIKRYSRWSRTAWDCLTGKKALRQ